MSRDREALAAPGFVAYWTAATIDSFGSSVTTVAVQVLIVSTLGATATQVGAIRAVQLLPYLLIGVVVGALLDRVRRRPVLVGANLLHAATLLLIPVLWVAGWLSLWAVGAVLFVSGALGVIEFAAAQSLLPRVVPATALLSANARLDQTDTLAQTTGPVLGGGLVSLLGAPWAILVDAASYAARAVLLGRLHVDEPTPRPTATRLRADIAEGVRWLYRHATLAPLAWSTHVWFLANSMATTVLVPFALESVGLGPLAYGVALALAGVGGLAGALLASPWGHLAGAGPVILLGRILALLAWAIAALTPTSAGGIWPFLTIATGQLVLGLGLGVENANEMAYWQALTPDEMQGRVNATRRSANRTVAVVGAALGGVLADQLGYRPTLWLAVGIFAIAAALIAGTRVRSARH